MKPIVINLLGAPCAGKSTAAAYIFSQLKMRGINCELITEYAKDKTWESNECALSCQEYVFGNQSYRMARCADKVDVIITDSPLLLSLFYNNDDALDQNFTNVVLNIFEKYDNWNYLIYNFNFYDQVGRNQTEEEAEKIQDEIKTFLCSNSLPFVEIENDESNYDEIVERVCSTLKGKEKKEENESEIWTLIEYEENGKITITGYTTNEAAAYDWCTIEFLKEEDDFKKKILLVELEQTINMFDDIRKCGKREARKIPKF